MAGKGFSAHVPTLHTHANQVAQRGEQVSQAGSGASGAGLHGSALGMIGQSAASGHQALTSRMQSAVSKAGGRLNDQSSLLHRTADNISGTDTEHAGKLGAIHPSGNVPTAHGSTSNGSLGMPSSSRPSNIYPDNYRPSYSSRPPSGRPSSSNRPSRYEPYRRPSSRPSSNSTYGPANPPPPPPPRPSSPTNRPPGSVVSLSSFTDTNGNIDYNAARAYMRRHYAAGEGINMANYNAGVPGHGTNCVLTTISGDAAIKYGRTEPAAPSAPRPQSELETAMGSGLTNKPSYNAVTHSLTHEPNGTTGTITIGRTNVPGHAFNVHKDDRGVINYVDFQPFLPANLEMNPTNIKYMQNNT